MICAGSGRLFHSLPDQSPCDLHAITSDCIKSNCQLVAGDCEVALDIFSDVAGVKSRF
jgi:hypothetical protein